jgi:uncharacterized protein YwqG
MASRSRRIGPERVSQDFADRILRSTLPGKEKIALLHRPAILAAAPRVSLKGPLGASRLGGEPDLPPDLPWPKWKGRPLAFVAQLDLEELPRIAGRELLPPRGRLYFFYALDVDEDNPLPSGIYTKERGAFPVFFSEQSTSTLRRTKTPADVSEFGRYKPLPMKFSIMTSIPDSSHPALRLLGLGTTDLQLKYGDVVEGCEQDLHPAAHNQILGYPYPVQNSVCLDVEMGMGGYWDRTRDITSEADQKLWDAALKPALDWELLLQVDTQDDKNGMIWGDCGRLYWMMRRQDLLERRFDRAWFSMQCT